MINYDDVYEKLKLDLEKTCENKKEKNTKDNRILNNMNNEEDYKKEALEELEKLERKVAEMKSRMETLKDDSYIWRLYRNRFNKANKNLESGRVSLD